MITHQNSPAEQLERAITMATEALERMKRRGVEQRALVDVAMTLRNLDKAYKQLPNTIPDGRNQFCRDCCFSAVGVSYSPLGSGLATQEHPDCTVQSSTDCPCVNAAGFLSDADIANTIPDYLRRQAE